jgi:hypothetical protein
MIQNKISNHFLIIGLLFSLLVMGAPSCKKTTDHAMEGEFYFVNSTSHQITFSTGFEKYNLAAKATGPIFTVSDIGDKEITASSFYTPFIKEQAYNIPQQPIIIRFDNQKCTSINGNSGAHNILDISSYNNEKIGERKYRFTYTFTEEDYNRATLCK